MGIPPDFEGERVYTNGALKQARYQLRRLNAMLASPGYFNSSIWDTLSGEYHRSFTKKTSYFHIFDYWQWNETLIDNTLAEYAWELAPDTSTTWRIGDGTAAFYNYIYRTVAGFTEHDTFRSNQIREGEITRQSALALVHEENKPRYLNIKWYLDALGMDFNETIPQLIRSHAYPKITVLRYSRNETDHFCSLVWFQVWRLGATLSTPRRRAFEKAVPQHTCCLSTKIQATY